jgi:hypothetical protein
MENKHNLADQVRADIAARMAEIKAGAKESMDRLDARIRLLDGELHQLHIKSVRRADVQRLIADDIRKSIEPHRTAVLQRAGRAAFLSSFVRVSFFSGINGDGRSDATTRDPMPLSIIDRSNPDPVDLLALVLTDARIDEFAAEAAAATGAPEKGGTIEALKAKADQIYGELEVLHDERFKLRQELDGLIDVALSPLLDSNPFNRPPQVVDVAPNPGPSVKQRNAAGELVATHIAPDRYAETMRQRYAADDAERAMQKFGH